MEIIRIFPFFLHIYYMELIIIKYKIGDIVTRNSYNNDIVFKILNISNSIVFLKGVDLRLYADSKSEDLVLSTISKKKKK